MEQVIEGGRVATTFREHVVVALKPLGVVAVTRISALSFANTSASERVWLLALNWKPEQLWPLGKPKLEQLAGLIMHEAFNEATPHVSETVSVNRLECAGLHSTGALGPVHVAVGASSVTTIVSLHDAMLPA